MPRYPTCAKTQTKSGKCATSDDGTERALILCGTWLRRKYLPNRRLVFRVGLSRKAREIRFRASHDALPAHNATCRKPINCFDADLRKTRIDEITESFLCGNRGRARHLDEISERRTCNSDTPTSQRRAPHGIRDLRLEYGAVGKTANYTLVDTRADILFQRIQIDRFAKCRVRRPA